MSEEVKQESANSTEAVPAAAVPGDVPVAGPKLDPDKEHHENIHDILMNQDEITWQSIIKDLIKTEQMDPWDVNVSLLSKMFIKTLKKLKEMNLHVSGKVLLCAALLLRIKSSRLVGDDIMEFDRLLASGENDDLYSDDDFVEGQFNQMGVTLGKEHMQLIPKTPQPRKRKVSVYDLIDALAIALQVKRRRVLNQIQTTTMDMPEKKFDISSLMDDLYGEVAGYLSQPDTQRMAFSDLVPGESKHDKVYTFVPLLHLTNARKVDLDQHEHFGEIWISIAEKKKQEQKAKLDKEKAEEKAARLAKEEAERKAKEEKERLEQEQREKEEQEIEAQGEPEQETSETAEAVEKEEQAPSEQ